jgi:large repetitive protein
VAEPHDPNKPPNPYTNPGRPVDDDPLRINLQPIDIRTHTRGLSIQTPPVLELIRPSGEVDTDAEGSDTLKFEWEVDYDLLGGNTNDRFTTKLYVSALAPGAGLWPDDDWRERPEDGLLSVLYVDPPLAEDDDTNPGRIITAPIELKIGRRYVVDITDAGSLSNPAAWVDSGPSGQEKRTIVEFDASVRRLLTAGQTYHWGVELLKHGESTNTYEAGSFESAPVTATAPFSAVTVLTHGFQLGLLASFFDNGQFQQPPAFMEMAQLIVRASGGGVVLSYDKAHGDWVDVGTGKKGAEALASAAGKAVVLVSDWYVESDISDSGFAEAAADALYTSLVDLDRQVGGRFVASATPGPASYIKGSLLNSPLHFIGHSRGTVVNSEIIQRLGFHKVVESGIHMTTLDPHDFDQPSLEIKIEDLLKTVKDTGEKLQTGAIVAGAAAFLTGNWGAIPTLYRAYTFIEKVNSAIEKSLNWAEALGVSLNIAYNDFKDPNVQVWSNVEFADNYYQTAASMDGVTATPNGRPLDPTPVTPPGPPPGPAVFDQTKSTADIDLLLGNDKPEESIAGFGFEDFGITGFGGPHSRVWQWYAGTIDTGMLEFADMPIWRSKGDQGLATEILSVIPLTTTYNEKPWYSSNPYRVVESAADRVPYTQKPHDSVLDIQEGIGIGWYFSAAGGGDDFRPDRNTGKTVDVTVDNTEVTAPKDGAVPSIFNGDFENGLRQSLYARATGADDKYRFPLSYELPGWSFHGGEGYRLNTGFEVGGFTLPNFDFTGLFVIETDPAKLGLEVVKKFFDWGAGKLLDIVGAHLKLKAFGIPKAPNTPFAPETAVEGYKEKVYDKHWSNNELVTKTLDFTGKVFDLFSSLYDLLGGPTVGDFIPDSFEKWAESLFQYDPEKKGVVPTSPEKFKDWLLGIAEKNLGDLFKSDGDYALLMGGGDVLKDIVYITAEALLGDVGKQMTDKLFDGAIEFDTIKHNRLLVPVDKPYLAFEILAPFLFTNTGKIVVEFDGAGADAGFNPTPVEVMLDHTGFMSRHTYWMEVPEEWRGKTGTLSLTKSKELKEATTFLPFSVTDQSLDPSFDPLGSFSQLLFIDDIRFTDSYVQVDLSANSVDEFTQSVTATLTLVGPINPAASTVVVFDWDDGVDSVVSATIAAGASSTTFTHTYRDDNPSFTPQDLKSLVATSNNTAAGGKATLTVRNVVPTIELLELDRYEIDEGDEVKLSTIFSDASPEDTYNVTIDWGDGESKTLFIEADDEEGAIEELHTYLDDHPAPAPRRTR